MREGALFLLLTLVVSPLWLQVEQQDAGTSRPAWRSSSLELSQVRHRPIPRLLSPERRLQRTSCVRSTKTLSFLSDMTEKQHTFDILTKTFKKQPVCCNQSPGVKTAGTPAQGIDK